MLSLSKPSQGKKSKHVTFSQQKTMSRTKPQRVLVPQTLNRKQQYKKFCPQK